MSERSKKLLLILAFIIATFVIAWAIYYLFFRPLVAPPPVAPPVITPPVGLPAIPPAVNIAIPPTLNIPPGIRPEIPTIPPAVAVPGPAISYQAIGGITTFQTLVDTAVKNPVLATNGQDLIYYDTPTGFFYTVTPDGQKKLFSDLPFKNVSNSVWSPNKQKVVLEYPDGSKIIYDFVQKKSVTLPSHWKDFTFSNDSNQIAFKDMRLDPENRFISVADTTAGNYQQIERLGKKDQDVYITWSPNNKYVALYRESYDADRSEVFPIGFQGENFRSLMVEGRDLRFIWTPSGNRMIYSVFNSRSNYNPNLWVTNTSPDLLGTGRNSLDISTWADKCTFASENVLYCAVPRSLAMGSGFRPDFADTTPDDIYKIDLATGTKELIAQPLFPTTVDKLMVSEDSKILYWQEKNTGKIKKMNL
jgi:hypothetical protein